MEWEVGDTVDYKGTDYTVIAVNDDYVTLEHEGCLGEITIVQLRDNVDDNVIHINKRTLTNKNKNTALKGSIAVIGTLFLYHVLAPMHLWWMHPMQVFISGVITAMLLVA